MLRRHYHHKYYLQGASRAAVEALMALDGCGDLATGTVDAFADSHLLTAFNGFAGDYGCVPGCSAVQTVHVRVCRRKALVLDLPRLMFVTRSGVVGGGACCVVDSVVLQSPARNLCCP